MNPLGYVVIAACCFVVGAYTAFVFSRRQSNNNHHHENQYNNRNESRPGQPRNLTCPFCGRATVANDFPLQCGHLCHVTCFRARPASTRDNCLFCHDDRADEEVSLGESSSRLHEEVRFRANRQPPSNINENDSTVNVAPPLDSTSGTASAREEVSCAFCRVWLELPANEKQLNCGHYAHKNCFESFKHLVKCQGCISSNNSSDSEEEIEPPSQRLPTTN